MTYEKSTVYMIGTSRINSNDPITATFDFLFVGIIVDKDTDIIVDFTCNMVKEVTSNFIKSLLVEYNFIDEIDEIINEIKTRFYGMAQKAVIAAVKDARNKYMMIKKD
ncbi:DUF3870 domain-containing protein [Lutibacter sp. B2]|nr:DUF3870 domain-containing protein [Lutibacter sp. B2]